MLHSVHLAAKRGGVVCVALNNMGVRRHQFSLGADAAMNDRWLPGRNNASANVAKKRLLVNLSRLPHAKRSHDVRPSSAVENRLPSLGALFVQTEFERITGLALGLASWRHRLAARH